jgi:riboflavin-specific deaminase-like protein
VRLDIITAISVNGFITEGRGRCSHDLIPLLDTPREILEHKWEIRRRYGAGLVGTNTVLDNDPTLTSHAVPGCDAVRVTVDANGRIPRGARFFDGSARTLIGVSARTPADYLRFLADRGVEAVPAGEERIDPAALLAGLAERGIASVLCEGGGLLNRSLLAAGLVGRMFLLVIPLVLEATSVNLFEGGGPPARLRLDGCERQGEYVWLEYAVGGGSAT